MHTNAQTYTDVSLDHSQTEIVFSKASVNDEKKPKKPHYHKNACVVIEMRNSHEMERRLSNERNIYKWLTKRILARINIKD